MSSLSKILIVSLLFCTASCTSCSKKNVTDPPKPLPTSTETVIVPPVPTTQLVESYHASVTVPLLFQDQHKDTTNDPNYRLFANMNANELLSLDAEAFSSSYEEYVLEAIRFIKETGGTIQSANSVTLNGQKMTLIESSREGIVAYFWVTTKDGYGYTFTCGGEETSSTIEDTCAMLSTTFQIK